MRALALLACLLGSARADDAARLVRFALGANAPARASNAVSAAAQPGLLVRGARDDRGARTPVELVQLDAWAGAEPGAFYLLRDVDERARLRLQGLRPRARYEVRIEPAGPRVLAADARGQIPLDFLLAPHEARLRVEAIAVRGRFPLKERERLDGPPAVSAWAWVICDAADGRVLWSRNADVPLPMASLTKLMTARLVLQRGDHLTEEVVVSRRADRLGGTTAALRTGERVAVRDLLYALLLPSGNDAARALAEHFGPVPAFVDAMNREARRLGLRETRYANPHGMDAPGHYQSARDLARLAFLFLEDAAAARLVRTAEHRARAAHGGTSRALAWTNTNELLRLAPYDGVKTGWTPEAGGCLVARGKRHGDRLLVVVLASAGRTSRFVDARNLFRWAWRQRAKRE